MRRVPRSPIDQARTDQAHTGQAARRRRLPAKWLAAALITAAVALLAPGMSYVTAGQSGAAGGLTVASRTFTLKRGWYWWGFGIHQAYQDLSAVCVTASESFGVSCVHFSGPAG